jgi:hypothetical protein
MGMDVNPSMLGGMLLGAAIGMRGQGGGAAPQQAAPQPAPQPAQRPDPIAMLQDATAEAQATPGLASTWLTGPQGVDPKSVKTTKQSLYGN